MSNLYGLVAAAPARPRYPISTSRRIDRSTKSQYTAAPLLSAAPQTEVWLPLARRERVHRSILASFAVDPYHPECEAIPIWGIIGSGMNVRRLYQDGRYR